MRRRTGGTDVVVDVVGGVVVAGGVVVVGVVVVGVVVVGVVVVVVVVGVVVVVVGVVVVGVVVVGVVVVVVAGFRFVGCVVVGRAVAVAGFVDVDVSDGASCGLVPPVVAESVAMPDIAAGIGVLAALPGVSGIPRTDPVEALREGEPDGVSWVRAVASFPTGANASSDGTTEGMERTVARGVFATAFLRAFTFGTHVVLQTLMDRLVCPVPTTFVRRTLLRFPSMNFPGRVFEASLHVERFAASA